MQKKLLLNLVLFSLLAVSLSACGPKTDDTEPTPAINMEDQISTAIAATATAAANLESADASEAVAVAESVVAMPPTPTPQPPVDTSELSEEEHLILIDEAVKDAATASEAASTSNSQASSDGTMTDDEVYDGADQVNKAEEAIRYAKELIAKYYELYGENPGNQEEIVLFPIEEDLDDMEALLVEIERILSQGAEIASDAIDDLDQALNDLMDLIEETKPERDQFIEKVKKSLEEREKKYANLPPNQVVSDWDGIKSQINVFVNTIKSALADGKVDDNEMQQIAQASANAKASIAANGGPQLQGISAAIDSLTRQISRGDWPQADAAVANIEALLAAIASLPDSLPDLPDSLPDLPSLP